MQRRKAKSGMLLGALLAITMTGCSDSLTDSLIGQWRGQPLRTQEKSADDSHETTTDSKLTAHPSPPSRDASQPASTETPPTDLERFDFTVRMQFLGDGSVRMELDGNDRPITGTWRVIDQRTDRAVIEIVTPKRAGDDGAETSLDYATVRHFIVRFSGDNRDRFTLQENHADPQLGQLEFNRVR